MSFIAGYLLGLEDGNGSATPLTIIPKTITENGEYNAIDDNADGFNPVIVNVPDRYDEGYEDGKNDGYEEGYENGKAEGYEEGKNDGYDSGYDDSFEFAKGYYSDTADTSLTYYVKVGTITTNAGSYYGVSYMSLIYYDTETLTPHRVMSWVNSAVGCSYDTEIISVRWLNDNTLQIKGKGYNEFRSAVYYCTWNYTLPNGYNSSNTTVGSAEP